MNDTAPRSASHPVRRSPVWAAAGLAAVIAAGGCESPKVSVHPAGVPDPDRGGVSGTMGRENGQGDSGRAFTLPDGGPDGPSAAPAVDKCAEEAHQAQIVPLDLLLLVDTSGSMNNQIGMSTKWRMAHEALKAFIGDPKSAGLGVGLLTFPSQAAKPCTGDSDCGISVPGLCGPRAVCLPPSGVTQGASACRAPVLGCAAGTTCTTLGRCSVSGTDCGNVGQPCAGGVAGDMCMGDARWCRVVFGDGPACDVAAYKVPSVPIADLPAVAPQLQQALDAIQPDGTTPMVAATGGALDQLKRHLIAHPDRRAVLVLATDGFPEGCSNDSVDMVATNLTAAHAGMPSLSTYVIGVFDDGMLAVSQPALAQLATAGGSGTPFVITSNQDLTQKFQEALNQIRGSALACEFQIPQPATGTLDLGKVNVRYAGAAGSEDLLYVGSADKCDPMRGGWYYDVNPAQGKPTRILVCDSNCAKFKTDTKGSVEVRVGCTTRID